MPDPRPNRDDPAEPGPLAPETHNSEQDDDAAAQAQTLADEALAEADAAEDEFGDKAPSPDLDPGEDPSPPDLVDRMNQMISSGHIDMGAYRGERNDDDVEHGLGPDGEEDDGPRGIE